LRSRVQAQGRPDSSQCMYMLVLLRNDYLPLLWSANTRLIVCILIVFIVRNLLGILLKQHYASGTIPLRPERREITRRFLTWFRRFDIYASRHRPETFPSATMLSVGQLIWASFRPLIRLCALLCILVTSLCLTICFGSRILCVACGFVITKTDNFPTIAARGAGQIMLNITLPCLLFSKIVPAFTSDNIKALGKL